jgi:hypothetical protein
MDDVMNIPKIVDDVEKDLLGEIVTNLKRNKLDSQKAQKLALEFLSLLPPKDFPEMIEILKKLSGTYNEARDVYIKYQGIQETMNDRNKASVMAEHISRGDIDKAIEIAKGGQNG